MKKPIIALTPAHNMDNDSLSLMPTYTRAVENAGGIPVIFPLEASKEDLTELANLCQGFIFTGGPDPHPFLWGEDIHKCCGPISVKRDQMELALLSIAMEQKKPILGICRGAQLINVGLGGDIYQDIDSQYHTVFPIAHQQPLPSTYTSHHIDVREGSLLAEISGGVAPDGLIEEIEMKDYPFFIGVQWHPEYLYETDSTSKNLFKRFVDACSS